MGNLFSKKCDCSPTEVQHKEVDYEEIILNRPRLLQNIINKYEYIKNSKNINDINILADIIRNTNWDKDIDIDKNTIYVEPTAPSIEFIPIAVAVELK